MVDFGLKLVDNKVADWSEFYIQYEKLKVILKKCEAALKRYEELAQRRPDVVPQIVANYRNGESTPGGSATNLESLPEGSDGTAMCSSDSLASTYGTAAGAVSPMEKKSQLSTAYGSFDASTSTPLNALARTIERAQSSVSGYYSLRYEKSLRDALRDIDKFEEEFGECLESDIRRVNNFYKSKIDELVEQVIYLRESVQPSKLNESEHFTHDTAIHRRAPSDGLESDFDDEVTTPLMCSSNRKHIARPSPLLLVKKIATWTTKGIVGSDRKLQTKIERESKVTVDPLLTADKMDEDDEMDAETIKQIRVADSIQRALVEHYRTAKLLQNFVIINYTGFVKIVKKHGKSVPKEKKGKYNTMIKAANVCNEGKEVELLVNRMERLYAAWFCDKNVSEARAQMLIKKGDGLEMDWSQLRLGYRMGMSAVLSLWVCWDCVWGLLSEGSSTIGGRTAFPVFRGCAGLLQLQWCWGISVWVWTRYRVNYIFLFDFDPNIVETPLTIFNSAVDNTLYFLICALLYYKAGAHNIPGNFPAGVFPFALVIYTVYQLIFPLRLRLPLWKTVFEVVTAPVTSPTFFHGYVGDIFTSMVKVFQDLVWAIFFVCTGDWLTSEDLVESTYHSWSRTGWYTHYLIPTITLLPLLFRFNQCLRRYADTGSRFPHLPNAFKYALSQSVSLFGAFHPLYMTNGTGSNLFQAFWMLLFISSSLYSFIWDVFMDWGLGRKNYAFLAQRLMYPNRSMYYVIIAIDLVLRFAWVLTLLPPESGAKFALPAYLTLVSMMLEIFRRTLWGFLRLENEHRSNTAGYRRVDFVPLHFATGHNHGYKDPNSRSGFSVLFEVAGVTMLVLLAAIVSVVAAQHATERALSNEL